MTAIIDLHGRRIIDSRGNPTVEVEVDGALHRIPHAKIAKARLEYDFDADLRRKE